MERRGVRSSLARAGSWLFPLFVTLLWSTPARTQEWVVTPSVACPGCGNTPTGPLSVDKDGRLFLPAPGPTFEAWQGGPSGFTRRSVSIPGLYAGSMTVSPNGSSEALFFTTKTLFDCDSYCSSCWRGCCNTAAYSAPRPWGASPCDRSCLASSCSYTISSNHRYQCPTSDLRQPTGRSCARAHRSPAGRWRSGVPHHQPVRLPSTSHAVAGDQGWQGVL